MTVPSAMFVKCLDKLLDRLAVSSVDIGKIVAISGDAQVQYYYTCTPIRYEPRHEKTNILVSDRVRHNPGCTAIEDG